MVSNINKINVSLIKKVSCQEVGTFHLCNIVFTWNLYARQIQQTNKKNSFMFEFSHYHIMVFITCDFCHNWMQQKCFCKPKYQYKKYINSINEICQAKVKYIKK